MVYIFNFLFSVTSHAALFTHIGTCRDATTPDEIPLRIFENTEEKSKGLIVIEAPDPDTKVPIISTEPITFKLKGNAYTVVFDENSLLKQISETSEFKISYSGKRKWVGKYRTFDCELGDISDIENMFNLAKKTNGSTIIEKSKETTVMDPYQCEKQTITFRPAFEPGEIDPVEIYNCYYKVDPKN